MNDEYRRMYETGKKMEEFGNALNRQGKAMSNVGHSMTCGCLTVVLATVLFFLLFRFL